jgi:hypothetical protein
VRVLVIGHQLPEQEAMSGPIVFELVLEKARITVAHGPKGAAVRIGANVFEFGHADAQAFGNALLGGALEEIAALVAERDKLGELLKSRAGLSIAELMRKLEETPTSKRVDIMTPAPSLPPAAPEELLGHD